MTGSIRIFEKSNFTPKLSVLVFLKVKLPNMTDWHINQTTDDQNLFGGLHRRVFSQLF